MRPSIALLALASFTAACGGAADEGGRPPRDSAGVQVVEIGALGTPPARWEADERPAVEIGAGDASGELYQVVSTFRTVDGGIVVANAGTAELRFFATDGTYQGSAGGSGEGPGEFQALFWAGRWRGDSIAAWDAGLARLSIFEADGSFARAVSPDAGLGPFPQVVAALPDGSVVLTAGAVPSAPPGAGVRRDTVHWLVMGPTGVVVDTLGRFAGREHYVMIPSGGGFAMHPLPFGIATTGTAIGDALAVGETDRLEITLHHLDRGIARIIRGEPPRRPVRPEDRRRYRTEMVSLGGEGDAAVRRQQEQLLREVPFPERMPVFTALRAGPAGTLWLEEPPPPDRETATTWLVIHPEGRLAGSARTPPGLTVHEIGEDWVLGTATDANGAERVRLHPLHRRSP